MNRRELAIGRQLYQQAITAGASPTAAAFLSGAAYGESGYNPSLVHQQDAHTGLSGGLMQVGRGLWGSIVRRGYANNAPAQFDMYLNALKGYQGGALWNSLNNASSYRDVWQSLHNSGVTRGFALGRGTLPSGSSAARQISNSLPFNPSVPSSIPTYQQPSAQPAPTPQPSPIVPPQGFGQLTEPQAIPEVAPPVDIPPMSFFWNPPSAGSPAQPPSSPSYGQSPGFANLGAVVPPGAIPPNPGSYNPEYGMEIGNGYSIPPNELALGGLGSSNEFGNDYFNNPFSLPGQDIFGSLSGYNGLPSGLSEIPSNLAPFEEGYPNVTDNYGFNPSPNEEQFPNVTDNYYQNPEPGNEFGPTPQDLYAQNPAPNEEGYPDNPDVYAPEGFGMLGPPLEIPDVPGQDATSPVDQPADNPNQGTYAGQPTDMGVGPAPEELPFGMSPGFETGVFAANGPFSTAGVGPQFSSDESGARFDTANVVSGGVDPFGGGTGGAMKVGISGPESFMDYGAPEAPDRGGGFKHGIDLNTIDSGPGAGGPTKWEQQAAIDPVKFWGSRVRQSRAMMGGGSQPHGPLGMSPLDSMLFHSGAGAYRGWSPSNPAYPGVPNPVVPHLARGGEIEMPGTIVPGPRSVRKDVVPIMAKPGEIVLNQTEQRQIEAKPGLRSDLANAIARAKARRPKFLPLEMRFATAA